MRRRTSGVPVAPPKNGGTGVAVGVGLGVGVGVDVGVSEGVSVAVTFGLGLVVGVALAVAVPAGVVVSVVPGVVVGLVCPVGEGKSVVVVCADTATIFVKRNAAARKDKKAKYLNIKNQDLIRNKYSTSHQALQNPCPEERRAYPERSRRTSSTFL